MAEDLQEARRTVAPVRSSAPTAAAPVTTVVGRVLDWHEAGWGTVREVVEQSFATAEVTSRGAGSHGAGAGAPSPIDTARAMLARTAFLPGCDGLELRHVVEPDGPGRPRVRLFVTAKSVVPGTAGRRLASTALAAAVATLPPTFAATPVARPGRDSPRGSGRPVIELHRTEHVPAPQPERTGDAFGYLITDRPGDGTGWPSFWHALRRADRGVEVSLLFKQTHLDPVERESLDELLADRPASADPQDRWARRVRVLPRPLLGRVAVRAEGATGWRIARALVAAIGRTADPRHAGAPMTIEVPHGASVAAAAEAFDWLEIIPWGGAPLWDDYIAPTTLRRLPYLYDLEEAAGLAVLPTPH